MSECRLQMIRDGKELIPRSCQLCGLFNRCQKFLDEPSPPKPTAESKVESQAAEIERLKAELELTRKERDQAIDYLEKVEQEHGILIGLWLFRNPDKYPDLSRHVAHLAGRGK